MCAPDPWKFAEIEIELETSWAIFCFALNLEIEA
jgi:hypothetical protein